jgi:hypothetical protein
MFFYSKMVRMLAYKNLFTILTLKNGIMVLGVKSNKIVYVNCKIIKSTKNL